MDIGENVITMQQKDLLDSAEAYEYVSFDLWDTLVFRTVKKPEDIFHLTEEVFHTENDEKVQDFCLQRIYAERLARYKNRRSEITLDMIYDELPYRSEIKAGLKDIEKRLEICCSFQNRIMTEVLKGCKARGQKILVTTDIYLPEEVVKAILCKFDIPYDYLFISSVIGKTKYSGELFPWILKSVGIEAGKLIHFGDNEISDIQKPRECGITARLRCAGANDSNVYTVPGASPGMEHLQEFVKRTVSDKGKDTAEERIGLNVIGPFLSEFCKWIHESKIKYKIDRLLFVAREGYFIKLCYEAMYPEEKETVGYTRIGKNILRLPSLEKGDIHKLRDSLPAFRTFTWSQIWEVLLVKEPAALEGELKHLFPEIDFEAEVTREHLFDGRYDKMLGVVLDHIKDTIQQQKEYLVSLLAQDGYTGCRVGLVNNSINGSGQYLLESFMKQCGLEGNILGLQIMRSELCRTRLGERAIGWLNVTHADRHAMFEFEKKSLVFEHFLFEPCGTAHHLVKDGDRIIVVCENARGERANFSTAANIQRAAMHYVAEYTGDPSLCVGEEAAGLYLRMITDPFLEDAELVSNLYNDDTDGDRKLSENDTPFRIRYIAAIKIPHKIGWIQAYFKINRMPKLFLDICNFSCMCRSYGLDPARWCRRAGLFGKVKNTVKAGKNIGYRFNYILRKRGVK